MIYLKLFFQKNFKTLAFTTILSLVIAYLINSKFIYPAITPMIKNGITYLFADWSVIVNANSCFQRGVDVFFENPCDPWNRKHVYGEILLHLPFVSILNKFYLIYFPLIINFLFIYVVISFFNYKKSYKNLTFLFFILSAPFIIAVERANIDILIFFIIYLISKNKNLLINHFFILVGVLSKFFPICFTILFLFKKNIKKIFLNLILISLIILTFLFFQLENLEKIFGTKNQFLGGNIYAFSFISLIKTINSIQIIDINLKWLKTFFVIGFLFLPFFLILNSFVIIKKNKILFSEIFTNDIFENRMYIISSATLLSCYFIIENIFYREIFFLGLIPWLLKNEDKNKNIKDFYFYFILFKFIITTILIYIVLAQPYLFYNFNFILILLKHTIDFYLILIIFSVFILCIYNFLKKDLILK